MAIDFETAFIAMTAANAAYEEDDALRGALLIPAGLQEIAYLQGANDARALVAQTSSGRQVIAFQGTRFTALEIQSILENLKDDPVDLGGSRLVMRGYYEQLQALEPFLAKLLPWKENLIVTGHSMGGTVAILYAGTVPLPEGSCLFAFGSPKCANSTFYETALLRPLRYVVSEDPAPEYPFLESIYSQPNEPWIWVEDKVTHLVPSGFARPGIIFDWFDHMPDNYLKVISSWQNPNLLGPAQPGDVGSPAKS